MRRVKLWFTGQESDKARKYCRLPKSRNPEHIDYVWVPFSLIEHCTRFPAEEDDEWPAHVVAIADWFCTKNGL